MTTVVLLIRHGDTDAVGRCLVGRLPHVHLNSRGREQAARVARLAATIQLAAVYSGPLERSRETARATLVQERVMSALERMRGRHAGRTFAVVSRADVIRAAVLRVTARDSITSAASRLRQHRSRRSISNRRQERCTSIATRTRSPRRQAEPHRFDWTIACTERA